MVRNIAQKKKKKKKERKEILLKLKPYVYMCYTGFFSSSFI